MIGIALLWMTIDVQASNPAEQIERLLARKSPDQVADAQTATRQEISALRRQNEKLRARLQDLLPQDPYIIVDTNAGRLFLKEGQQTLLSAVCSTGKGDTLIGPKGQIWVFRTPLGVRTVKRKKTEPIWTKPDWAFIEENEPIPKDRSKRLEEGVLGDYALDIGDDYMIHGTIYTRLLGRPVTHGCVRVGDDDLKVVYDASKKGTKVYLF